MKHFTILLILTLLLNGCVQNTPSSESIANSATESLNAISATLTKDCKTTAIESQINAVRIAINASVSACQTEKEVITAEKLRWKWAFITLLIMVLAYIARKVLK